MLPTDSKARKDLPVMTGVVDYFPDALLAVAQVSVYGNDKHNPGQPLHWSKEKSTDHADCALRHLMERGKMDYSYGPDKPVRHSAAAAWRALANLQMEIENEQDVQNATPVDDNPWRSWDGRSTVPPCDPYITVEVWFAGSHKPSSVIWHASTWCWKWSGSRPRPGIGDIVAWRPYKAPTQDGQS